MTRENAIQILLLIWRVVKAVTVLTAIYGFVFLRFLLKTVASALPMLFYFVLCFFGGVTSGAAGAAAGKATSGRPYYRVWSDEEHMSSSHHR